MGQRLTQTRTSAKLPGLGWALNSPGGTAQAYSLSSSPSGPGRRFGSARTFARMTPPSRYTQEFVQGARLGKGGFGMVYRARHILDGVEYAVKKATPLHSRLANATLQ